MWQIGNAVPPRLAECIGYGLIPSLNNIYLNQKRPVNFPHCQQTQLTFD
jgi:DNA (cytosine-5)-methyltransferase 1